MTFGAILPGSAMHTRCTYTREHLPMTARPGPVAIVDDDEAVVDALTFLLQIEGYEVEAYRSADDFLSRGTGQLPACLILDQNMPGMSGLELAAVLAGRGLHIPIVMLTAALDEGLRARAIAAGIGCILAKPPNDAELVQAVETRAPRR